MKAYQKQLAKLGAAFRDKRGISSLFGFGGWGLHDARLLAFSWVMGWTIRGDGRERLDVKQAKGKSSDSDSQSQANSVVFVRLY